MAMVEIGKIGGGAVMDTAYRAAYRSKIQLEWDTLLSEDGKFGNVRVLTEDDLEDTSPVFGTPVFMPLTFEAFSYYDYFLRQNIAVPELTIPACVVTVNFTNIIVKTEVQGSLRPGTFKEWISQGDYTINIDGVIGNDTDERYPTNQVAWLHSIGKAPVAVGVIHKLLNRLGIDMIVIESGSFTPKQGMQNLQTFQLNAVSDFQTALLLRSEEEIKQYGKM
jgi:hypothetical protein